jgi:hypothetical protein
VELIKGDLKMQSSTRMKPATRLVLWFIAVNALLGAISLLLFPTQTDTLFFWPIKPPINAALMGALYLGGAVAVGFLSYKGRWEPARFLVPVLVSAGIFISLTTLLHSDKFVPGFKFVYWMLIYVGAPILAILLYVYQERQGASWDITEPVKPMTRLVASITGGIILVLGILLIIWPQTMVENWAWPITPLMLRIFASWFSAFGVGLLWFLIERNWQNLKHIANLMIGAAGLDLIMIFLYRDSLTASGFSLWIYCFHLSAFVLIGVLMHWLQRKKSSQQSSATQAAV